METICDGCAGQSVLLGILLYLLWLCGRWERGAVLCIYYGFADAGRGELSCLLAPVPGCKKP